MYLSSASSAETANEWIKASLCRRQIRPQRAQSHKPGSRVLGGSPRGHKRFLGPTLVCLMSQVTSVFSLAAIYFFCFCASSQSLLLLLMVLSHRAANSPVTMKMTVIENSPWGRVLGLISNVIKLLKALKESLQKKVSRDVG